MEGGRKGGREGGMEGGREGDGWREGGRTKEGWGSKVVYSLLRFSLVNRKTRFRVSLYAGWAYTQGRLIHRANTPFSHAGEDTDDHQLLSGDVGQ